MSQWEDRAIIDSLPLDTSTVSRGKVVKAKCPHCSDHKERLYFLWSDKNDQTIAYCHRGSCDLGGITLKSFVKRFYPNLYSEHYRGHKSRAKKLHRSLSDVVREENKKKRFNLFKDREQPHGCIMLEHLHANHKALKYVEQRKIPKSQWNNLYYCSNFKDLARHYGHDSSNWIEEDRLIIPFWNQNKEITFLQGRSFNPQSSLRYITIKIQDEELKIWGLDKINLKKRIYVAEGPIDAMFLPNAIAMAGADVSDKRLMEILRVKDASQIAFAYDNEPKSEGICKKMEDKVRAGFSIVLWNSRIVKEKDVNDMVLSGFDINKIEDMVFNGIRAKVRLKRWKKIK